MNATTYLILFIGAILLTAFALNVFTSSIFQSTSSGAQTVSTTVSKVMNQLEVVSAISNGYKTFLVVSGYTGSVPITKTVVLIDNVPYTPRVTFFKDNGEENVLNPGDLAYVELNTILLGTHSVLFSSATTSVSAEVNIEPTQNIFSFRRLITIHENSGNALSNHQVRIELNSSNFDLVKLGNTCSGVRFYDLNGNSLAYWVETCGDPTVIWVKIPSIPANGDVNIYMYYGNIYASSKSNGTSTFIFFEDFANLSNWTCTGDCSALTTTTLSGRTVAVLTAPAGTGFTLDSTTLLGNLDNVALEAYFANFGGAGDLDFSWGIDDDVYGRPNWGANPGDNATGQYHALIVDEAVAVSGTTYAQPSWLVHSIYRTGTAVSSYYNGEFLGPATGTPITSGHMHIFIDPDSTLRGIYIDWIRIRKYYWPEPTFTLGPEEEGIYFAQ